MRNRKRNRKKGFDYSSENIYFITICCKDRLHQFGKIDEMQMQLNEYGQIVENQIEWLEDNYPYFQLHNAVVMPNHIHLLVEINTHFGHNGQAITCNGQTPTCNGQISTCNGQVATCPYVNDGRVIKIKSVSELMGALKTTSSKQIHLMGNMNFKWQRSFHDHIVSNANRYDAIYAYISENPSRWTDDVHNEMKMGEK